MLTQEALTDCRFCSQVSKANGEDPIGTAGTADYWLVMELAQPWSGQIFQEDSRTKPLTGLLQQLFMKHGIVMRPLLIAPDPDYSQPGKTRLLYYRRPQQQFAQFEKQEFIVPEAEFPRLATAIMKSLMNQSNELQAFQGYRQETSHIREILVCTHGNVDTACARFGHPIYKKLREEYGENMRVWRCSHFGGHQFAPTLIDLPDGHYWGHLEPKMLDLLIYRNGDVTGLRSHYRGWAGLSKFEQVAEREIWMQKGWSWLSQHKSGKTVCKELTGIKRYLYPLLRLIPLKGVKLLVEQLTNDATWAEVQIQVHQTEQKTPQTYTAQIEVSGQAMSAWRSPKSGEKIELHQVPQYRVSRLVNSN